MITRRHLVFFFVVFSLLLAGAAYAQEQPLKKANKGTGVKEVQMKKKEVKKELKMKKKELKAEKKEAKKEVKAEVKKEMPKKEVKKELKMKKKELKAEKKEAKKVLPVLAPVTVLQESVSSQAEAAVMYTDEGFSPSSHSVKVGTPVTFTNQSGHGMWVASAPHPTHRVYPEFDQGSSTEKDGTYSFTFTKAGTWKYHNHLKPGVRGEVTVTE